MWLLAVLTADCINEGFCKKICGRYAGQKNVAVIRNNQVTLAIRRAAVKL